MIVRKGFTPLCVPRLRAVSGSGVETGDTRPTCTSRVPPDSVYALVFPSIRLTVLKCIRSVIRKRLSADFHWARVPRNERGPRKKSSVNASPNSVRVEDEFRNKGLTTRDG